MCHVIFGPMESAIIYRTLWLYREEYGGQLSGVLQRDVVKVLSCGMNGIINLNSLIHSHPYIISKSKVLFFFQHSLFSVYLGRGYYFLITQSLLQCFSPIS